MTETAPEITEQQMCADLARAMGWHKCDGSGYCWVDVDGNHTRAAFDTNAADSRALVEWLARTGTLKQRALFLNLLLQAAHCRTDEETIQAMLDGERDAGIKRDFALLTAPLPVIARAAWEALKQDEIQTPAQK